MDADYSKHKRNKDESGNPEYGNPKYTYQDHLRYAKDKLKAVDSFSEDKMRRFKDGAVKIISDIYEKHTGMPVDINNPPPIAMDLSQSARNATLQKSLEIPSTSLGQQDRLLQSLRAQSDQFRMTSTFKDVMVAKKSYVPHVKRRKHSGKYSRGSYTSASPQDPKYPVRNTESPSAMFPPLPILREPPLTTPRWYLMPSEPTKNSTIVNLDSDED